MDEENKTTETPITETQAIESQPEPVNAGKEQAPGNGPSHSWQASEYIFHEKPTGWYLVFWLGIAIIAAGLAFFRQWLSIAVVIAMALAVVVYSRKEPRTLQYDLDDNGVSIDGKETPFSHFKSFSVIQEVGWHEVDLEPSKRFVPRLTLLCEAADSEIVESILAAHLPKVDRGHDWIERATRYLRF